MRHADVDQLLPQHVVVVLPQCLVLSDVCCHDLDALPCDEAAGIGEAASAIISWIVSLIVVITIIAAPDIGLHDAFGEAVGVLLH